jgi:DNA ligase (NAD+)
MKERILQLIGKLNKASNEYYNGLKCSMTDLQWDKDFDELKSLEEESGIVYSNSPTQNAGYPVMDGLEKIKHSTPLLSLGKTKSIEDLKTFLGNREGVLSFKMDGGTQIADYNSYKLNYLATRGSSSTNEGQNITHNSNAIIGIPKEIVLKDHIQVVGEGIMYKSKLEEINSKLQEDEKYANTRNLANATSSMLDSKIVSERDIRFVAFGTLEIDGFFETKMEELEYLKHRGFDVVPHVLVTKDNLEQEVERMTKLRPTLNYDIDGLVLAHNDLKYGLSLGKTSHHFKNAIAYKFEDDEVETTLTDITVDIGKSGQVSYVGEFETVELCGTKVSKASLSNYSLISQLQLGIGDTILVRKANEIIPQITDNLTRSATYQKATHCPYCGSELVHDGVHQFCKNFGCERQVLGRLVHFCSRDCMDIRGLSEETLSVLMENANSIGYDNKPLVYHYYDIYLLHQYKEDLYKLERFGKKKVDNLLDAIENSKTRPLENFIYGLSIPQVGRTASKKIAEEFGNMDNILKKDYTGFDGLDIMDLVGESCGSSFNKTMSHNNVIKEIKFLQQLGLTMTQPQAIKSSNILEGKTFVVTGEVNHFKNRKELEVKVVSLGGKIGSGVSKATSYLINNDTQSNSSKNVKAKELGVPIISEEEFLEMIK